MSSVTVICPNARRQQVKVQANTKILQILEEVCKKQGLNPDEYDLVHIKRKLDVTLTWRLSGLTNNTCLDLVKSDVPRKMSDVTIALQLEDGTRLTPLNFKPETCLNVVLNEFRLLQNTSFINLEAKAEDSNGYQPVVSYLNDEIISEYQLENTQLKDLGLTSGRVVMRYHLRHMETSQMADLNAKFKAKIEKFNQLPQKSSTISSTPQIEPEKHEDIDEKSENNQNIQQETLKIASNKTSHVPTHIENEQNFQPIPNEFANFKFPESTRGMKLNQESSNELAEVERLSKTACDREALVFSTVRNVTSMEIDEPNDDFFDININDLKIMINDLQKKANEENVLMTKAMRELEDDKKAMRYDKVAIRIKFKNQLVLQGFFRPKEQISVLYEFVSAHIKTTHEFYLYTSPPRIILNEKKKTLFECQLYPAANIYFGDSTETIDHLKDEHMSALSTIDEANNIVKKNVHERIRVLDTQGIDWLQREHSLTSNIMRNAQQRLAPHAQNADGDATNVGPRRSDMNNYTNQKLNKFLGKK